jgi:hypothetical protein
MDLLLWRQTGFIVVPFIELTPLLRISEERSMPLAMGVTGSPLTGPAARPGIPGRPGWVGAAVSALRMRWPGLGWLWLHDRLVRPLLRAARRRR